MTIEINKNLMNEYDENGKCFIVQTPGPVLQNFFYNSNLNCNDCN
jgi:hypothetical protein